MLDHRSQTTTYFIEPSYRIMSFIGAASMCIGFGLIFPAIVLLSGFQDAPRDLVGTGIVAGLSFVAALATAYAAHRWQQSTFLSISTEGLVYQTSGLTIQTPWSNVERLGIQYGKAELWLKQPAAIRKSLSTSFTQATTLAGRHLDRRIPLSTFTIWSKQSPMYHDIARCAPHLLKEPISPP